MKKLLIAIIMLPISFSFLYGKDWNAYLAEVQVENYPFMDKIADFVLNTDLSITTPKGKLFKRDSIYAIDVYDINYSLPDKLQKQGSYFIQISSTMIFEGVYYCFSVKSLRLLSKINLADYFISCSAKREIVPREKIILGLDEYAKFWLFEIKNGIVVNAFFICEDWNMKETDMSVYDLERKQLMTRKAFREKFYYIEVAFH